MFEFMGQVFSSMPIAVVNGFQPHHLIQRAGKVEPSGFGVFLHHIFEQVLSVCPAHKIIFAISQCQLIGRMDGEPVDVDDGNDEV